MQCSHSYPVFFFKEFHLRSRSALGNKNISYRDLSCPLGSHCPGAMVQWLLVCTSTETFGRKLRLVRVHRDKSSTLFYLFDSIHSAASHTPCTPLLWLLETWFLCGCTFWKSPTAAHIPFSSCTGCHQSCAGAGHKGGTFRESIFISTSFSWSRTGLRWVRIFISLYEFSYGLFLCAERHGTEQCCSWGSELLSACPPDAPFSNQNNGRLNALALQDWAWSNPTGLAGEVWRHEHLCCQGGWVGVYAEVLWHWVLRHLSPCGNSSTASCIWKEEQGKDRQSLWCHHLSCWPSLLCAEPSGHHLSVGSSLHVLRHDAHREKSIYL